MMWYRAPKAWPTASGPVLAAGAVGSEPGSVVGESGEYSSGAIPGITVGSSPPNEVASSDVRFTGGGGVSRPVSAETPGSDTLQRGQRFSVAGISVPQREQTIRAVAQMSMSNHNMMIRRGLRDSGIGRLWDRDLTLRAPSVNAETDRRPASTSREVRVRRRPAPRAAASPASSDRRRDRR